MRRLFLWQNWHLHLSIISQVLSIDVLLDCLLQRRFGDGSNDGVHLGSVLEEHDGGDAPDAVLCRHCWALVGIQLELRR